MEALGARRWIRRKNRKAMHRLRAIMEEGAGGGPRAARRGRRVTVAGG